MAISVDPSGKPIPTPTRESRVFNVMTKEAYTRLERLLPPPVCTPGDSSNDIAFRLGVQAVLKVLREGFVS